MPKAKKIKIEKEEPKVIIDSEDTMKQTVLSQISNKFKVENPNEHSKEAKQIVLKFAEKTIDW